ncbi:MAG: 16S rRNA (guanine(527)-N(7))-methyltransferase RsmG [Dehalococcoidales bacterium]
MATMQLLVSGAAEMGLILDQVQLDLFQTYYEELVDWNRRLNLTSITGFDDVQLKHFLDSLTVTLAGQPLEDARVIDIGAGAGFPGLPLKIVFPDMKLVLLESRGKKATFLEHIVKKLGYADIEVIARRAEEVARLTNYRESFDIVLARAVAPLPELAELALPFAGTGSVFIAQKKGGIDTEVEEAAEAIKLLGGRLREVKTVDLKELAGDRRLVIIDKVSLTPQAYPRRPGMPKKRPIT